MDESLLVSISRDAVFGNRWLTFEITGFCHEHALILYVYLSGDDTESVLTVRVFPPLLGIADRQYSEAVAHERFPHSITLHLTALDTPIRLRLSNQNFRQIQKQLSIRPPRHLQLHHLSLISPQSCHVYHKIHHIHLGQRYLTQTSCQPFTHHLKPSTSQTASPNPGQHNTSLNLKNHNSTTPFQARLRHNPLSSGSSTIPHSLKPQGYTTSSCPTL